MRESKLIIDGKQVVYDLSPLIDLALERRDFAYCRELWHRNQLYWKFLNKKGDTNGNH